MQQSVFAVIGCGGISRSQHLPNLSWAPHARLKTVCDLREDAARTAQKKYNVPVCQTDHRKVLADPEIDAVVVATRDDTHASLTLEALQAGKHVYVEKPLAQNASDCNAVVRAQTEADKHVAVGFNRRFAPAYCKAKELLAAHGGPWNIYYRITDQYSLMWGKDFPPGLRVFHEVCHVFDVLRWFVGSEPVSVYSVASRGDDEVFVLHFASGPIATILSSGYATADLPKESIEIIAEKGALTIDNFVELRTFGFPEAEPRYCFPGHVHPDYDFTHRWLYRDLGAAAMRALHTERFWRRYAPLMGMARETEPLDKNLGDEYASRHAPLGNYDVDKGWIQAIDHFGQCIAEGRTPRNASAFDGLRAQEIAEAAVESRASGHVIPLA